MTMFKTGDRVGEATSDYSNEWENKRGPLRWHEDSEAEFGTVVGYDEDGRVLVKWDNSWLNQRSKPMKEESLGFEEDIKVKLVALEAEFNLVFKQVKEKVKQAADMLLEANALAQSINNDLSKMYSAYGPLYHAMDESGWRTSSFGC